MNKLKRCSGCMTEIESIAACPSCGWVQGSAAESVLHLPPDTLLDNKYLIGRVLGQGGFGITYLAWDTNLNTKLAIKEYLPQQLATRTTGSSRIIVFRQSLQEEYKYGLFKFLEEARTLARFSEHPNIVTVRDYFEANSTAYLVMNYHEGVTLQSYLDRKGGRISVEQAISIFMPVLDALKEVHAAGVLHRDISPDNLMINTEGRVILIDFGAARQAVGEQSRSLSVIMKAGYSPPEQYQSKGKQGPWTDIYAVAATFYRSITGQAPLESIDRLVEDNLAPPSQLGIAIEPNQEKALIKALAVRTSDRFQKVESFQAAVLQEQSQAEKVHSDTAANASSSFKEKRSKPGPMRGKDVTREILLSRQAAKLGSKRSIIAHFESICLDCGGTGIKNRRSCNNCSGEGKQQRQKKLSVQIPAGVKENTRIRLQGQGEKGINGGANGDLFLVVKLKDDKQESSEQSRFNSEVAREKEYAKENEKPPRSKNLSFAQKLHQYMYNHFGSRSKLLNYITAGVFGLLIITSINSQFGGGSVNENVNSSAMQQSEQEVADDRRAGIVQEEVVESGQTFAPAVIAALDADYYIDYENGTTPIGDLPIGTLVVDPSFEWEFRTGNDYTGSGAVKSVTWIIVAKDHYSGLDPHVTLLSEELIGRFPFDNSTNRGSETWGSNHWGDSGTTDATNGIRPFLNSTSIHANEGFYRAFSDSFKGAVLTTTVPNKEWKNGSTYSTQDRVFLTSTTELGDINHNLTYPIGSTYPYFKEASYADWVAMLGDDADFYWTRSPDSDWKSRVHGGYPGAPHNTAFSSNSYGVRPALNLKSEVLVSEIKN